MKFFSVKPKTTCPLLPATLSLMVALASTATVAAPNNAPSFSLGPEPTSSACDGEVRFPGWAQNVTDNDGGTSGLSFEIRDVTNQQIYVKKPHLSWPSLTLSYQLKPGTAGDLVSTITAVLQDTSGTGQGGSDTSGPQSWNIYTESCADADGDGISDADEGSGVLDTDGDGTADSQDNDSDNDGLIDANENNDSDGDGISDSAEVDGDDVSTDSDGDGISDELDIDDDNDGIIDSLEGLGQIDTDQDNLPDSRDLDSDNDGLFDFEESGIDLTTITFTEDGVITSDSGINGFIDVLELNVDGGTPITALPDSNQNGIPDFQDPDGIFQSDESTPGPAVISTGLNGTGTAFDPFLFLLALIATMGIYRRKGL